MQKREDGWYWAEYDSDGNPTTPAGADGAAARLGVNPSTLSARLRALGLRKSRRRQRLDQRGCVLAAA